MREFSRASFFCVHWRWPRWHGSFLLQIQTPQTVSDLGGHLQYPNAFHHHQFAGQGGSLRGAFALVVCHTAVLAVFIPAEAAIGNTLRSQLLEAAKQGVVLWNLEDTAAHLNFDKLVEGTQQRSRGCHAEIVCWVLCR